MADETLRQEIENAIDGAWTDVEDFDASTAAVAVLPIVVRVRAADRAEIAAKMDTMVTWYPEDVFPPDSRSPDAVGARAMRHAYGLAAQIVRGEYEPCAALAGEPERD